MRDRSAQEVWATYCLFEPVLQTYSFICMGIVATSSMPPFRNTTLQQVVSHQSFNAESGAASKAPRCALLPPSVEHAVAAQDPRYIVKCTGMLNEWHLYWSYNHKTLLLAGLKGQLCKCEIVLTSIWLQAQRQPLHPHPLRPPWKMFSALDERVQSYIQDPSLCLDPAQPH